MTSYQDRMNPFVNACVTGDIKKASQMIKDGVSGDDLYNGILAAICVGYIEIVKLIMEKRADGLNISMGFACYYNHVDIIKLIIDRGGDDWNNGMLYACLGGHIDTVKLMIEKGANNWTQGMEYACYYKNMDIVILMLAKGADIDKCLISLTDDNVDSLVKSGVTNFGKYDAIAKECMTKITQAKSELTELMLDDIAEICVKY